MTRILHTFLSFVPFISKMCFVMTKSWTITLNKSPHLSVCVIYLWNSSESDISRLSYLLLCGDPLSVYQGAAGNSNDSVCLLPLAGALHRWKVISEWMSGLKNWKLCDKWLFSWEARFLFLCQFFISFHVRVLIIRYVHLFVQAFSPCTVSLSLWQTSIFVSILWHICLFQIYHSYFKPLTINV